MKKKHTLLCFTTCLIALLLLLCGCSDQQKFDKAVNKMTQRLSEAKTVTQTVTVKDGDVLVYQLVKTVEFNGNEANITVEKSELANDFTLQKTVTKETADKDSQLVLPIKLQSSNLNFFVVGKQNLSCVAGADKAAALLGVDNYPAAGDVNVNCILQNGSLLNLDCNYSTTSKRNVTVSVICEY